ncbi:MAG: 16S rRNA (guanine(966)-N(2))-methyltransferase RsmD [bacterium]
MRIISGIHRGRTIKVPKSKFVRPTTDRNRESIFNYLNNIIDFDGVAVCDLYAGSGSLGLEALSRGAGEVHFVEKNYEVYKTLAENISTLKADEQCKIWKMEAIKFSKLSEHPVYDLILCDPPFFKDDIHDVVSNLRSNNFLSGEGILLIERSIQTKENDIEYFGIEPVKRLGDSLVYVFGV